jgi:hypothetical protein
VGTITEQQTTTCPTPYSQPVISPWVETMNSCAHCNDYDPRDNTNTDYIAARSSEGQDPRSWVWGGYEPRDFKQAYADSRDSIERCTGIPAGVTV